MLVKFDVFLMKKKKETTILYHRLELISLRLVTFIYICLVEDRP